MRIRKLAVLGLVVLAVAALALAGCCSFDATKRAQVKASLELLQGGYDTSIGYLGDPANQGVDDKTLATLKMIQGAAKLGVPLIDAALDQLGQISDKKCPTEAEVNAALAKAQEAAKVQQAIPAAANPTTVSAPAPTPAPAASQ